MVRKQYRQPFNAVLNEQVSGRERQQEQSAGESTAIKAPVQALR